MKHFQGYFYKTLVLQLTFEFIPFNAIFQKKKILRDSFVVRLLSFYTEAQVKQNELKEKERLPFF